MPHDFMTMHAAKAIEYLIAIGYLLLFIPFWRFVNARPKGAAAVEHVPATRRTPSPAGWFAMPEGLFYHPGHAWLRVSGRDTVRVGFDEFAARLIGTPSALRLPAVGAKLAQGEPAWAVVADDTPLDMLSPVDGTVTAVNIQALASPELAHDNPYGAGWLLEVRAPRLAANLKQLLNGQLARRWMQDLSEGLRATLSPALGAVYQDGGAVVDGLAKTLDPDGWDRVARRYLLTDGTAVPGEGGDHA